MRNVVPVALVVVGAVTLGGCATLFAPGPDIVQACSEPQGAVVKLDDVVVGRTPCFVSVERSSEGVFTFELEGYETATVDRDKVCNGMTALNLLGGYVTIPVFFAIDILSGNIGKYSTKPIYVQLVPLKPVPPPPARKIPLTFGSPGERVRKRGAE